MNFSSALVEKAVKELSKLPSIGQKSALRLVLHILKQQPDYTHTLAEALIDLRDNIKYCTKCHAIADETICNTCANPSRDKTTICVVEETKDVLAIENTNQFFGQYHVLGGVISPIEGISIGNLNMSTLFERIEKDNVKELILALGSTMEGDTTGFYISKKLKDSGVKVTSIARGVPVGGEIEYADEITLGRSIQNRTIY